MISEFPLFAFTTLSGLAAGGYAVGAVFRGQKADSKMAWLFPLVCIVLLGLGLCGTLAHLGHPERFLNALANPASMIAEEAYWSIAFGVLMVIDAVLCKMKGAAPAAVCVLGALAAIGLMCVTANAFFTMHGNPVSTSPATLALFVVGDFAMGAAMVACFRSELVSQKTFAAVVIVILVLCAASIAAIAAQFAGYGFDMVPFIAGLIVGPVAGIVVYALGITGKLAPKVAALLGLVLVLVGVVIARYFFYAASIL